MIHQYQNEFPTKVTSNDREDSNDKEVGNSSDQISNEVHSSDSEDSEECETESEHSYQPLAKASTNRFKILPQLVASLDHAKISNAMATSVILPTLHSMGVDVTTVEVSATTLWRHRNKARELISKEIRETFGHNISGSFFVLHFDGKILPK